jgi:segregation and condensation protein B
MSYPNLSAQLEAIIYLAKEPIGIDSIHKALPEVDREALERAIQLLIEKYQMENHGIEIREVADGLRFATKPEHHEVLRKFLQSQNPPTRLSLAALETLAVIAYRQPVTKAEIEAIRGVQAGPILRTLVDRGLVRVEGRADVPGHPLQYATTRTFLDRFGLGSLDELPRDSELTRD